jgi:hypothetical protein
MLHENGVPGPLVPATVDQQKVLLVLGMLTDIGQLGLIITKNPGFIFVILPMPPCFNWYGQKNFGKPNAEVEQKLVDQNVLVCYNIGILQQQYFNLINFVNQLKKATYYDN